MSHDMMMIALAYFAVFGMVLLGLCARYLWTGKSLNLSCPTGVSHSVCLIKRALQAMGRIASGIVLTVAFLLAVYSMIALYQGNGWALIVLSILGMLSGLSVSVQMRERGFALAQKTPWRVALAMTLGVPAVAVAAGM